MSNSTINPDTDKIPERRFADPNICPCCGVYVGKRAVHEARPEARDVVTVDGVPKMWSLWWMCQRCGFAWPDGYRE